ncbi:MAG: hypothetical protein FXF47_01145 [Candidatus Mcinerneyibacterium aminivorans]|uniref:Uncharacterized protein n=1 Tax=Candidatus Mcinerneyibacterium aminivorans TaxID=2703815 RepID=A0A5D0MK52_9BACT|nr:MAG: hypothetical protein FXF47_01145 [Candidatus Mcinerneyibacterium aminivorans]
MFDRKEIKQLENFLFREWLSIIRHDLNNYLTVMLNYSNFIEEDKIKDRLKKSVKETITYLQNSAEEKYGLEKKYNKPLDVESFVELLKTKLNEFDLDISIKSSLNFTENSINNSNLHLIIVRYLLDTFKKNERMFLKIEDNVDYLCLTFKFEDSFFVKEEDLALLIIKRYFSKKSIDVNFKNDKNIVIKIPF